MKQNNSFIVQEINCRSAIGKCGFPGGGWAINPYVGCQHACVFCYARFIRRFTKHTEPWGGFVDVRINIAEVLRKQMESGRYRKGIIFIGTVTDPYQPLENKYQLTRQILKVLKDFNTEAIAVLTRSALVLRDIDLLKQIKHSGAVEGEVGFSVATTDENWRKLAEPYSSSIEARFAAMKKLSDEGVYVYAMMGPYLPYFTNPDELFVRFKKAGVRQVFTESLNTVGGNWSGVEEVLKKHYPDLFPSIKETLFDKQKFTEFYQKAREKVEELSARYKIPATIYFAPGHGGKFK
ncbi:MAG: radical SAM protein [bacterium]|nr:radical SAM protein [bacterium]